MHARRAKISLSQLRHNVARSERIPSVHTHEYLNNGDASDDFVEFVGVLVASEENVPLKDALRRFLEITPFSKNVPIFIDSDKNKLIRKLMKHAIKNESEYLIGADMHIIAIDKRKIKLRRDGIFICQKMFRACILDAVNKNNNEAKLNQTNQFTK